MIAFGPVPSRRLGRSLGINNIPPKHCTYSCAYCQLGQTKQLSHERRQFYRPEQIVEEVTRRVDELCITNQPVDYLTFVADGEPTLDRHLGSLITQLRPLGVKIAVITNASLLDRPDVRDELSGADWVSLKVDTVHPRMWLNINRPDSSLRLEEILTGMRQFAAQFRGTLTTETMLVRMLNDSPDQIEAVAQFVAELKPAIAYLAVPTRPPAEPWVEPATEDTLNCAFQIFCRHCAAVEFLTGYEGDAFSSTGDLTTDLLSITAVHPLRDDAVQALLAKCRADATTVQRLVATGQLTETEYEGHRFYLRTMPSHGSN
jgi:wyosine [tRNA(Phe)-imidazoG37] synthetase (radical SAM superfamily)